MPRFDGRAGFGKSDGDDRIAQLGPLAHATNAAVQFRFAAFLHCPDFIAHRIVNHADNNFALTTQRDRNAKMRDAVEIIHGAIERIDHPLIIRSSGRRQFLLRRKARGSGNFSATHA